MSQDCIVLSDLNSGRSRLRFETCHLLLTPPRRPRLLQYGDHAVIVLVVATSKSVVPRSTVREYRWRLDGSIRSSRAPRREGNNVSRGRDGAAGVADRQTAG